MATQAHIAGTVKIDGVAVSRKIIVIKDDHSAGYAVVGEGESSSDGTFDVTYYDWAGAVIVLSVDTYGAAFQATTPLPVGAVIHPTLPNGYVYYVTISGTTGAGEPTWVTDSSVISGSVTLTPQPYYRPIASGPLQGELLEISDGDPLWDYVESLLLFNGSNGSVIIIDEAARLWAVTGGAALTTIQSKFGGSSLYLNGTSSYLQTDSAEFMQAETLPFTLEGWLFPTADVRGTVITNRNAGTSGWILRREANGSIGFSYIGSGKTSILSAAGLVPSGEWTFFRVDRDAAGLRLYLNNDLVAEAETVNAAAVSTRPITIGASAFDTNRYYYQGFIDSIRMTFGIARPTESIQPADEFPVGPV